MRTPLFLSLVAIMAVSPLAAGCSGAEDGDVPAAGDEADLVKGTSFLGDVGGVKIKGGSVVAAPKKVERILTNLGLQKGAKKPREGAFRCMPRYTIEFLKPNGETLATAGLLCGGDESGPAEGTVRINNKSYIIGAKDVGELNEIAKSAPAVGDLAFGTDKVEIKTLLGATKVTATSSADIEKALSSLDANAEPDWNAALPKCLPSKVVSFYHGKTELMSVAMLCSGETGKVLGTFTAPSVKDHTAGGISINAGVISALEKSLR